jgi:hypothetical protein
MLHVFDDETGNEIFAFIPSDLLPRLQEFSSATTHVHMLDGPYPDRSYQRAGGYWRLLLLQKNPDLLGKEGAAEVIGLWTSPTRTLSTGQ